MSKFRTIKTSFNGGEISKQLYGRVDLESFIASNKHKTFFLYFAGSYRSNKY